ncbi:MAG: pyridoxine 5'-phosphate synthase [Victivallaceae bacterium]|nr:pyridoxine 5'-phosphate synthase [Victivallaceae bacterium]
MLRLGVNIDHVATLRQARGEAFPSVVEAAKACEAAGAWGITAHLREDRRHINDVDIVAIHSNVKHLNMEMAVTDEMIKIASDLGPNSCCLVPEKRMELTTEGGLNVAENLSKVSRAVAALRARKIKVSLFIDPDERQIVLAREVGADSIELHTGSYANASGVDQVRELDRLIAGSEIAAGLGLGVHAGHGIDYENIAGILKMPHLTELNIGFSIIARALFVGLPAAVSEMRALMDTYDK